MCLKDQNSMKMYPLGNVERAWPRLSGESHASSAIGARIKDSKVWRGNTGGSDGARTRGLRRDRPSSSAQRRSGTRLLPFCGACRVRPSSKHRLAAISLRAAARLRTAVQTGAGRPLCTCSHSTDTVESKRTEPWPDMRILTSPHPDQGLTTATQWRSPAVASGQSAS
jgi:hypothetical protein